VLSRPVLNFLLRPRHIRFLLMLLGLLHGPPGLTIVTGVQLDTINRVSLELLQLPSSKSILNQLLFHFFDSLILFLHIGSFNNLLTFNILNPLLQKSTFLSHLLHITLNFFLLIIFLHLFDIILNNFIFPD